MSRENPQDTRQHSLIPVCNKVFCPTVAKILWRLYPTKMHLASAACFQNSHKLPCRLWNLPPPLPLPYTHTSNTAHFCLVRTDVSNGWKKSFVLIHNEQQQLRRVVWIILQWSWRIHYYTEVLTLEKNACLDILYSPFPWRTSSPEVLWASSENYRPKYPGSFWDTCT